MCALCRLLVILAAAWQCVCAAAFSSSHVQGKHPELETEATIGANGAFGDGRKLIRTESSRVAQQVDRTASLAVMSDGAAASAESRKLEQDCVWYDWSPWSYCSKTCGHGYKTRSRSQAVQQRHDGTQCTGETEQVDYCNTQSCPVDCQWGDWDVWSKCTHSCDGGTRQRGKPIVIHNNSVGTPCNPADGMQSEDCATTACPRDCEWGLWSVWSACSATCAGGNKTRHRSVARVASAGGDDCTGSPSESEGCNARGCPKDCVMGDWGDWDTCSASCGNGTKARQRTVLSQEENGGAACVAPLRDEVFCKLGPCRADCIWGDWSEWSSCAVTCGGSQDNVRTSFRAVAVAAVAGGRQCEGKTLQSQTCGQDLCPVDCQWSHWTTWRACSKTCGGGITDRYRNHTTTARNGGATCTGSPRDVKHCARDPCPTDCRLSEWSDWGDCSTECGAGEAMRFRSELVPATLGGQECDPDTSESKQCLGTDCVSFAWLLKNGATAVSGSMVGYTQDPITFASNYRNEQVTKRFLAVLPRENVTRVHVSMMPSKDLSNSSNPTDVHIWFSMVIPNTSNPETVLANLNVYERDPQSVSPLYANALASGGINAGVNVTDFEIGKIKRLKRDKFFVTYNKTEQPNKSNASDLVDWNNPLRPRVNCACRLAPPSTERSEKFGEAGGTLTSLQKAFAEMAALDESQVRSAQVPRQAAQVVDKFVAGATLTTEQKQAWNSSQAGTYIDSWISILGDKEATEVAAIRKAHDMSDGIMREDNRGVTDRVNDYLVQNRATDWTPSNVTFMLCRPIGDLPGEVEARQEEKKNETLPVEVLKKAQEAAKADIRVTGVLELQVLRPRMFSSDARTEMACKGMISKILDVPLKRLQVSIVPKKAVSEGDYFESLQQREARASIAAMLQPTLLQLGDSSQPQVEELSEDELNSMDDSEPMRGKGKGLEDETMAYAWFVARFPHNETAAADSAALTMRQQDLAMTGLKLQNILLDMHMTLTVTVTAIKAEREVPKTRTQNSTKASLMDLAEETDGDASSDTEGLERPKNTIAKSAAGHLHLDLTILLAVALCSAR